MPKSTEIGKLAEFKVIEHLMKTGFTTYIPIIDTGVDLVAERLEGSGLAYYEFQVKSSRLQKSGSWAWNVNPWTFRVSEHNLLICVIDDKENPPPCCCESAGYILRSQR